MEQSAEDNAVNRALAQRLLQKRGFVVFIATPDACDGGLRSNGRNPQARESYAPANPDNRPHGARLEGRS